MFILHFVTRQQYVFIRSWLPNLTLDEWTGVQNINSSSTLIVEESTLHSRVKTHCRGWHDSFLFHSPSFLDRTSRLASRYVLPFDSSHNRDANGTPDLSQEIYYVGGGHVFHAFVVHH